VLGRELEFFDQELQEMRRFNLPRKRLSNHVPATATFFL
jgi:hypothetical protein